MTALRRQNSTRGYVATHRHIQPGGSTRSCGRCGQFKEGLGGKKLPVRGWCCWDCVSAPKAVAA